MIVKERDAAQHTVARLEQRAGAAGEAVLRDACRGAAARLRDDPTTERACRFVDASFAASEEWAVIHDLRLLVDGHKVQVNHVLVGDTLEIVVVDTRFIDAGLRVSEEGRCEVLDGAGRRIVTSPLAKMARDLRKLGEELRSVRVPSERLLLRPRPALRGCVLIDPACRLGAAMGGDEDRLGFYPREALYRMLWKRRRRQSRSLRERLPREALLAYAGELAARHRPTFPVGLLGEDVPPVRVSAGGRLLDTR